MSSKSTSPYLMSNSFNFDVIDILKEIKAARIQRLAKEKYGKMSYSELKLAYKAPENKPDHDLIKQILEERRDKKKKLRNQQSVLSSPLQS